MQPRPLPIAGGRFPAICAPLVARTHAALLDEAAAVARKGPDLLEWRVDFFDAIADRKQVLETLAGIRRAAPGMPLLFTRRSAREGGEPIRITEDEAVALYRAVCESRAVELVDFEMGNDAAHVQQVRDAARECGVALVLSFHDFAKTPDAAALGSKFATAHRLGADVAKVAVMPQGMDDVLALLSATLDASNTLPIPVVSMAMGPLGAITRTSGWAFGSAMTFAVGQNSSAPGQMPIGEMAGAIEVLKRAMGR